jgi:hypothetical protein
MVIPNLSESNILMPCMYIYKEKKHTNAITTMVLHLMGLLFAKICR